MARRLREVLESSIGRVERSSALDGVAGGLAKVAGPLIGRRSVRDALSGTWLGHAMHPILVAVPIGIWSGTTVLDLTRSDPGAARRMVGAGAVLSVPTAAAGLVDWHYTSGPERRVGTAHALLNAVTVVVYGASWLARRRGHNATGVALALGGASLLSASGYLGGHLSYAQGVAVDTTAFRGGAHEWTRVASASDIVGDALVEKRVDGVSILLSRVDGNVRVIDNRCTHRGGPLDQGLREGNCVRCPWHQSVFRLDDGSVAEGPATRPQGTFEVRVDNNNIEVRRRPTTDLRVNPVGA